MLFTLHIAEDTATHSAQLSHHCKQHWVLLALLPACAGPRVINCQDAAAYAAVSLQTTCLVRVDHQHDLQDMLSSLALQHSSPIGDRRTSLPVTTTGRQNRIGNVSARLPRATIVRLGLRCLSKPLASARAPSRSAWAAPAGAALRSAGKMSCSPALAKTDSKEYALCAMRTALCVGGAQKLTAP